MSNWPETVKRIIRFTVDFLLLGNIHSFICVIFCNFDIGNHEKMENLKSYYCDAFLQQNTYFSRNECEYVSHKQIFLVFYQRFKNMHVSEKLSLKKIGKHCVISFGHN